MPPQQAPPNASQPQGNKLLTKRFTWDSMRKKSPHSTTAATTSPPIPRAQTSLGASFDSSADMITEEIGAYNLKWEDLQPYLQNIFKNSCIDYSNKYEDQFRAGKDKFIVQLPRALSKTERKEIERLRKGEAVQTPGQDRQMDVYD